MLRSGSATLSTITRKISSRVAQTWGARHAPRERLNFWHGQLGLDTSVANKADVEEQSKQEHHPSQHAKILVVDDEQDLAEVAATVLNEMGYETAVAYNGYDALELLRSDPEIILLFTDVIMPGDLDGYALAAKALEMRPNLKVCLSSGFTGLAMKSIHPTDHSFSMLCSPSAPIGQIGLIA